MGHNDDNRFKSAHAAAPGKGYGNENDDGVNGRSNEKHRNNVGNDEGWLSAFLAHLWDPQLRKAFTKLAWELLPDLLQASSPPWMQSIELTKFNFGKSPPKLSNFNSFKDSAKTDDAMVAIEADVSWHSDINVQLRIKPIPKQLTFIPSALTTLVSNMVSFTAGIEKLHVEGRIRITFDPLVDKLPVIGAVKVSFVEQPDTVDFEVSVMGGSTLSGLIPSLKAWLVGFARDSLISMYVMPEHWTYRLDPSIKDVSVPAGMLEIDILEAHHIPKGDYLSDSNPYIEMFMRASQKRRTTIQPEGKEATWNESFKLPVHIPETQELELILYDHDNIGSDDELGRIKIAIRNLKDGELQDLWLDFDNPKEEIKQDQRSQQHDAIAGAMKRVKAREAEKKTACKVHIKLKYHSMNKEEMNAIAEAQNKGDMDLLYKHPRLKSIAGQGVITIKLNSVDRLVHPAWWRGGHKHVKVKCVFAKDEKVSQLKRGTRHNCRIDETIQLEVTGDKESGDHDCDDIVIEVHETKWWQKNTEGMMAVSLAELKKHTKMAGKKKLKHGNSPDGRLDLEMSWSSYLGLDDD